MLDGLEGAADANDDGIVTSAELWVYLQEHVAGTAEQEGWNQTPNMVVKAKESFVFPSRLIDLASMVVSERQDDAICDQMVVILASNVRISADSLR